MIIMELLDQAIVLKTCLQDWIPIRKNGSIQVLYLRGVLPQLSGYNLDK